MSAAAVVIALFVNGVQVLLPAPAFLEDGTSWVPARVVLERMGCDISLDGRTGRLAGTSHTGERYYLTPAGGAHARGVGMYTYKDSGECLYIPARALADITGGQVTFDRARSRLDLRAPLPTAPAADVTTIADLLRAGPEAVGRTVTVEGEYFGHSGRDDGAWLLRGDGGTLPCASTPRLTPPFRLSAYGGRGRRLRVTGTVACAKRNGLLLLASGAAPLPGLHGKTCFIELARPSRDGTVWLHLMAGMDAAGAKVRLRTHNGNDIRYIAAESVHALGTGGKDGAMEAAIEWRTHGLPTGEYAISVELPSGVRTYEVLTRLGE